MAVMRKNTPGVYVREVAAFPPSIVGVETAVPAFIGYTERAALPNDKEVFNTPIRINSMADYEQFFGGPHKRKYTIAEVTTAGDTYDFSVPTEQPQPGGAKNYDLTRKTKSFILYDSLRLFYANGGGPCYIVSVGNYADAGVTEDELAAGLEAVKDQIGPTMLVMPDAINLKADDETTDPFTSGAFKNLAVQMIEQSAELGDRVAILDFFGALAVTESNLEAAMTAFRAMVGTEKLSYGMAYFPFLNASVIDVSDVNFANIDGIGTDDGVLQTVLTQQNNNLNYATSSNGTARDWKRVDDLIKSIKNHTDPTTPEATKQMIALQNNLTAALPLMGQIERLMTGLANQLPSSPAIAGIFTSVDSSRGVWNAPANVSLSSVSSPTYKVTDTEQEDMNLPIDGKAVDAIREFVGRGTIVWGARTLDGNSGDYRYIPVRRTLIYIEQSIKLALDQFVFADNDGQTWSTVVSMCSTFLQQLWNQGGLMGDKATEAFNVECGVGSTMTNQDILDGYMRVQVTLQMFHPAEFIILTFTQKMGE